MKLRTEGVAWQEIDGELVILDLSRSVYLTTNGTGAFVAKMLREERSLPDLVDALVAQYGVERATAERDVDAFVASLAEKSLLQSP